MLQDRAIARKTLVTRQLFWLVDPRQTFIIKRMARWHKNMRVVKSADVNFHNWPDVATVALPSQRCAAFTAKSPANVRGRLVDIARFTVEGHLIGLETHECPNPRTTVFTTALTVTMANDKCVSCGCVSYCAAHAATGHCRIFVHFPSSSFLRLQLKRNRASAFFGVQKLRNFQLL